MQNALNWLKQALYAMCDFLNGLLGLPSVDFSLPERQPLANHILTIITVFFMAFVSLFFDNYVFLISSFAKS